MVHRRDNSGYYDAEQTGAWRMREHAERVVMVGSHGAEEEDDQHPVLATGDAEEEQLLVTA
jgi:hypothetical protein